MGTPCLPRPERPHYAGLFNTRFSLYMCYIKWMIFPNRIIFQNITHMYETTFSNEQEYSQITCYNESTFVSVFTIKRARVVLMVNILSKCTLYKCILYF